MTNSKYLMIFVMGILLQVACILGGSIYSLSQYNDIYEYYHKIIFIPNFTSYILVIIGLIGLCYKKGNRNQ